MRSKRWIIAAAAVLAFFTAGAVAGEYGKCTADTQTCLDMMVTKLKDRGWVGLELDSEGMEYMVVKRVVSGSPAEAAGFKIGDQLVALNGIEMTEENGEALHEAKSAMAPGKQVTYEVERNGAARELTVTLATVPDDVLAAVIGRHMLDHAAVEVAQN